MRGNTYGNYSIYSIYAGLILENTLQETSNYILYFFKNIIRWPLLWIWIAYMCLLIYASLNLLDFYGVQLCVIKNLMIPSNKIHTVILIGHKFLWEKLLLRCTLIWVSSNGKWLELNISAHARQGSPKVGTKSKILFFV